MPKYNVANIREIQRLLTEIADTLARAYSEFSLTEPDWDRPLAPGDANLGTPSSRAWPTNCPPRSAGSMVRRKP
jgi:hypothetical protein